MPGGVGATVKRQLNWTTFICRSLLNLTEVGVLEIGFKLIRDRRQSVLNSVFSLNDINVSGLRCAVIGCERGEIFDHFSAE